MELTNFISFALSYLANNVPTIIDFVHNNKSFESRIKICYDKARKQWKCQAVREKYEGREMSYLSDLKDYLVGSMDKLDPELQELLGRWVMEMRKDELCSAFITDIKLDGFKDVNQGTVKGIQKAIEGIDIKLDSLDGKLDGCSEDLKIIIKKIDGIGSDETRKEAILRELFQILQDEASAIIGCTATVLSHGGIDWWGMAENKRALRVQIDLLRDYVTKYQIYFSKEAFSAVISHYELAIRVQCELDNLVMAIFSADNQDGITDVYYLTYERTIEWTSVFVSYLMEEFMRVDTHPSYKEFAALYREHEASVYRLSSMIERKMGKVL